MAEIKTNLPKTYFAWSGDDDRTGASPITASRDRRWSSSTRRSRATSITSTRSIGIPTNDYGARLVGR